jgi:GH24 family phage-related lysozyme (muramidase)
MSTPAVDFFIARAEGEEGYRQLPYDDATGKPVVAPIGNLSWGIGFNLMKIGSKKLFFVMLRSIAEDLDLSLSHIAWYAGLPPGVASACLDIAYNAGEHGLLHYPHMISFLAKGDYASAAKECTTTNPKLSGRYAKLAEIIAAGV